MERKVKLKAGRLMVGATIWEEGNRLFFRFGFNKPLMEELKAMEGAKFHGYDELNPRKLWSIVNSQRNNFQLQYLEHPAANNPLNPYSHYDKPLLTVMPRRKVYNHQVEMFQHMITRHYCIIASEMGTGKTLVGLEAIEYSKANHVIWVAPKSALYSVMLEAKKWDCKVHIRFMTYDTLKKIVESWPKGEKAPQLVIFDESSRCKNITAQRTQASKHLADSVRADWGEEGYVILMSGSPAPKSPIDWWSQCEIACPGFLREGTPEKLRKRLAIMEAREAFAGGGAYNHLVTWKDDSNKCNVCGLYPNDVTHTAEVDVFDESPSYHKYEKSVNEVELLYKRMRGLVFVKFKKDCLQLPDKVYREVYCKPTRTMLNAAAAIEAKCSSTIQALTLLRELSDGFQYIEIPKGEETCTTCHGTRTVTVPKATTDQEAQQPDFVQLETEVIACEHCHGKGMITSYVREAQQIPTPKEDYLKEILDEHDDVGRIVIYGGFTGSIDRICSIVKASGWDYIRVDGRGWFSTLPGTPEQLLDIFQNKKEKYPRVAFDGQPGAAGMGLTLTASPTIVYYSNDFNAESRIQSEDRIHRIGMDNNLGATIIDLLCLSSDTLVLNNLKKKRRLQDITMGEMKVSLMNLAQEAQERE